VSAVRVVHGRLVVAAPGALERRRRRRRRRGVWCLLELSVRIGEFYDGDDDDDGGGASRHGGVDVIAGVVARIVSTSGGRYVGKIRLRVRGR
jgi:hypothetical protein